MLVYDVNYESLVDSWSSLQDILENPFKYLKHELGKVIAKDIIEKGNVRIVVLEAKSTLAKYVMGSNQNSFNTIYPETSMTLTKKGFYGW